MKKFRGNLADCYCVGAQKAWSKRAYSHCCPCMFKKSYTHSLLKCLMMPISHNEYIKNAKRHNNTIKMKCINFYHIHEHDGPFIHLHMNKHCYNCCFPVKMIQWSKPIYETCKDFKSVEYDRWIFICRSCWIEPWMVLKMYSGSKLMPAAKNRASQRLIQKCIVETRYLVWGREIPPTTILIPCRYWYEGPLEKYIPNSEIPVEPKSRPFEFESDWLPSRWPKLRLRKWPGRKVKRRERLCHDDSNSSSTNHRRHIPWNLRWNPFRFQSRWSGVEQPSQRWTTENYDGKDNR